MTQAGEFTGANININPVRTGQMFIISVELHDFSHGYWGGFKHIEITPLTHATMAGDY